jgi:hypothetical protein
MIVILNATTKTVRLNGAPCRIWEGYTSSGIKMHAFINRCVLDNDDDLEQFEFELKHSSEPSEYVRCYPFELIL